MPCTLYLYPSRLRFLSDNKQVKRRERFLCFRHGRVQLWATYTPHFGPSSSFVPTTMSFLSLSLSLFEDESFRTKGLTSTVLQLYHVSLFRRQNFNYSPQLHIVKCQFNSLSLSLYNFLHSLQVDNCLILFYIYIYI